MIRHDDEQRQRGIERLLAVVAELRGRKGCPWDREQTLASLKPYLIEESYEVLDAIDADDPGRHAEELGDVLLQVALQSRIREERGDFTFDDVADGLADKLVRRHPHVFGTTEVSGTDEVLENWETLKAAERAEPGSAVEGIPRHLPALQKAQRVQSRASRVGFDWEQASEVLAKVEEEISEIRAAMAGRDRAGTKEEIGDLLFALVNLCRFLSVDAEDALQATTAKFVRRFQEVERRARRQGRELRDCTLAEMDAHWEAAKREEMEA
jgi:tetrapyrrole methylase family protein/MazG family protein